MRLRSGSQARLSISEASKPSDVTHPVSGLRPALWNDSQKQWQQHSRKIFKMRNRRSKV